MPKNIAGRPPGTRAASAGSVATACIAARAEPPARARHAGSASQAARKRWPTASTTAERRLRSHRSVVSGGTSESSTTPSTSRGGATAMVLNTSWIPYDTP